MRVRSKSFETEAMQWDGSSQSAGDITDWAGLGNVTPWRSREGPQCLDVNTPNGTVHASPGDWIVRDSLGAYYPCVDDVFRARYEEITMADKVHQPLPVAGYKPQSEEHIAIVNANKELEERCLRQVEALAARHGEMTHGVAVITCDPRWLAIGRTHLELAFMAINRAVFQPERAKLPEDEQ